MQTAEFAFVRVLTVSSLYCFCPLESPVLKWLCFMWCGAATLVLLALPKLIIDNSATLDTQVGRLFVVYGLVWYGLYPYVYVFQG